MTHQPDPQNPSPASHPPSHGLNAIDVKEFLAVVLPSIQRNDPAALAQDVRVRWTLRQITSLLRHLEPDVRRVAAVTLGFVGDVRVVPALVRALKDVDRQVNQMAEHSLWSIWFRAGDRAAQSSFKDGVRLLEEEKYDDAIEHLMRAARIDPTFTEPLHQCAMAHFFNGHFEQAVEACTAVLRKVPVHFGAMACLGHCYMQLGEYQRALDSYTQTLRINPCMPGIGKAIRQLQDELARMNDSSGYFHYAGA